MFGRAADAVEDTDALDCLAGLKPPTRLGPLDLERTAGAAVLGAVPPLPGDRSNRSARAFTLFETWGEARLGAVDEAGPDTDRGVDLGGGRAAPFATGWRWRVAAISAGGGAISCWVVV